MPVRALFGPADPVFSARYLSPLRAAGCCRTFAPQPADGVDLALPPDASWEDVRQQLPPDWQPGVIALWCAYRCVPRWVLETPVPVLGLAADWNWLWDGYLHLLPHCDRIWTDTPGVTRLRQAGVHHAYPVNLYGGPDGWLLATPADCPRDIDVLFVGNLQPAVQRGRLGVVARLAELGERYQVVVRTGVPFDEYHQLLRRSRVVLNPTARGEWNLRVAETVLSGALLAVEADNREVLDTLRPDQECLAFTPENLLGQLRAVLEDEPRRQCLARAAQERLGEGTFAATFRDALAWLEPDLGALRQQRQARSALTSEQVLKVRVAARLQAAEDDPSLLEEVLAGFRFESATPEAVRDLALLLVRTPQRPGSLEAAVNLLVRGWQRWPTQPVLGYHLVRALLQAEQPERALEMARQVLKVLTPESQLDVDAWTGVPWPVGFDEARVEWARAGWLHAGQPQDQARARREVLLWDLHRIVGNLSPGDVIPFYESVLACPDVPRGRASLGCALARAGRLEEALPHLQAAVRGNPFDQRAAAALAQVLGDTRRGQDRQHLEEQRRRLHRAAPDLVPLEGWFAGPPPQGDELASLIVLAHNQLEFTRLCLESVRQFTRAPYELVLVDNGSTDETPAYLEGVKAWPEPTRVVVLRNADNRGFGAGCNQGIAAARGRYLVFLNNDTIVTPGWLQGLIGLSHFDWPRVGLTGAVSNAATPEQTVPTAYTSTEDMLTFAHEHTRRHAGQARELDRLSGFCLLARREVIDRVGGFDERFGLGFFEDDDLCLRARRAGYRLLVALDVFVHHFGSRTVQSLGINPTEQLQANHARFLDKWADATPEGYRRARITTLGATAPEATEMPQPVQPHTDELFTQWNQPSESDHNTVFTGYQVDISANHATEPARVSLCIIVKNEVKNLRACVEPVRRLFCEVVVNDTGSTDGTVALARELGARVVEHPWQDHFSQARNQVIEAATGDWIFWLDADDRVDEANARKLQALFAALTPQMRGYALTCRCLSRDGGATDVTHVRLFPRHPQVRWRHRVHEQILPAIRSQRGDVTFTDIVVHHVGYTDPELRGRKLDRDLRLLEMERQELGDHPFTLFNLGCIHLEREAYGEALPLFESSLEKSHVRDSIVRKLYAQVARCHWQLGQRGEAMAGCKEGLGHYPQDDELLFLLAQYHQESGELEQARVLYHRLIEGEREGSHFGSTATGLRGFRAMNNLALVYQRLGDVARAEAWFRRAVEDHPGFVNGWVALGELLAGQRRWQEAEEALTRAMVLVPGDAQLQGRLEAVRRAARG